MADKKSKKPKPSDLGSGAAKNAAEAMINRHKVLEDMANGSYAPAKKKKK